MKYYVRTTKERILDKTYSQIDYELLIDFEHKPVESFIKQLETISEEDAVLLEDDLILCKDFKNKIEEVIRQYPNKIINFFTNPNKYFSTRESDIFAYNQCTYYPKGIAKQIALEMKKIEEEEFPQKHQYDILEGKALKTLGITHLQYRPCLVQHIDNRSLIQKNNKKRRTLFFVDYLEELGISYFECSNHRNVVRLKYLLLNKFKS